VVLSAPHSPGRLIQSGRSAPSASRRTSFNDAWRIRRRAMGELLASTCLHENPVAQIFRQASSHPIYCV
jgi:hypothetical protein